MTFAVFSVLLFSCGTTENAANSEVKAASAPESDESRITGTWFWDYSFDQNKFGNEQLIFNKDGTCDLFSIGSVWSEFDRGNYSIIEDKEHGKTLLINLHQWKSKREDEWEPCDPKLYYALEKIDDDELIMHRYKRDFTGQGGGIEHSEPTIYQHYLKVKNGTASKFTGTWKMNKALLPDVPFEVTWTVNEDGTLKNEKVSKEETVVREGSWEVQESNNANTLHVSYSKINGEAYSEEYWYEYYNIGENLNKLTVFKQKINGKEENVDSKEELFYYRDLPLLTYTYTLNNATDSISFKDYYPENKNYELIQINKPYLFGQAQYFAYRTVIDWYDNPEFSGSPVTDISASENTKNREFWGKTGFMFHKNEWNPEDIYGHNYAVDYPCQMLFPNMKFPSKGDTVRIALSATVDKNLKGVNFEIIDNSEGWNAIGSKYLSVSPVDNKISLFAVIPINQNPKQNTLSKLLFNMYYMHNELDEPCSFKDFNIELFDENNPGNIITHTLNYGNQLVKAESIAGVDFILPGNAKGFEGIRGELKYDTEIAGWYDNPEFTGNPVRKISGENNTKPAVFYGKYNLKKEWYEKRDDGSFYQNFGIPVTSEIPGAKINPKAGEVVKVAFTANVSEDYEGRMGLDLFVLNSDDGFRGNDWHYVKTKNKKLQTCFEINISRDANFASMDEAGFLLAYNPVSEKHLLTISDFKFELVDEDPFITESAETPHVTVEPCAEGLKFTVRKSASDKLKLDDYFSIYITEKNCELNARVEQKAVEENGSVSFVWPFVEKGKAYSFRCSWEDGNGIWYNELIKVRAQNGKGEINYSLFDKIQLSLESNSKESNVCAKNLSKANIMELVKNYKDELWYVTIQIPFIAGKNDWSNSEWLFGQGYRIYPDEVDSEAFYEDLMNKGKANIFGDYNFWWGDKKQFMNEEFTKYKTFWTRLDVSFKYGNNPDCVEFNTVSNVTDEVPYTTVQF